MRKGRKGERGGEGWGGGAVWAVVRAGGAGDPAARGAAGHGWRGGGSGGDDSHGGEGAVRVAVLARVSSERQAADALAHSVPNQVEQLRLMAERRGWEVVRVFEIPGETAYVDDMAGRPLFREAVEAACRREFEALLISEFSRFSRS